MTRQIRTGSAAKRGGSTAATGTRSTRTTALHKGEVYHEVSSEDEILRTRFEEGEQPAIVRFSAGLTINLGNFESLRIDCSVSIPCKPTDIEEAHRIASDFVAERVAEEESHWVGGVPQKSTAKRGK